MILNQNIDGMNDVSEKRKRINRYKKIIIRVLIGMVVISLILWIYIVFKINKLDDQINGLLISVYEKTWRMGI